MLDMLQLLCHAGAALDGTLINENNKIIYIYFRVKCAQHFEACGSISSAGE